MSIIEIIIIFVLILVIFLIGTLIGVAKKEYDSQCEMEYEEDKKNNQIKETHIK